MDINNRLAAEFNIKIHQVENTVKLIDEGNTIPFIARYRKEVTGSLDDQLLRELFERLIALMNVHKVELCWVKGHDGHPENERCDRLAVEAAKGPDLMTDVGYMENI